ncbi:MAG: glycosyltransferase family 4 protein [Myxococcota bacterium]
MRLGIFLGYGLTGSGSTVYSVELAETLSKAGHEVHFFCHETSVERLQSRGRLSASDHGGVTVRDPNLPGLVIHAWQPPILPVTYPRPELANGTILASMTNEQIDTYVDSVCRWIQAIDADTPLDAFIVNHVALMTVVAERLAQGERPIRVVVHGTGLEYGIGRSELIRERVSHALDSDNTVVIALNDSVADRTVAAFPSILDDKLEIIAPGTDIGRFVLGTETPGRCVFVGRLSLDKGLHTLLLALPEVCAVCPNFHLDIVGDGPEATALQNAWSALTDGDIEKFVETCRQGALAQRTLAEANHVLAPILAHAQKWTGDDVREARLARDTVRWHGHRSRAEVADILSRASLFVLPSIVPEAHPLSVCEAMSVGVPVIGTDLAGIRHLLLRAERVVPSLMGRSRVSMNSETFVQNMSAACIDHFTTPVSRDEREKLRQLIVNDYSWSATADRVVGAIDSHRLSSQRVQTL